MVGYHRRLSRQILELRRLLAANVIGDVRSIFCKWLVKKPIDYFKNWRVRRESGGGCLMINAIHEIDTLQYLFGPIALVGALEESLPMAFSSNVEHVLSVTMKLQSGPLVTAAFSDQCPSPFSYENTVAAGTKFPRYSADCYHFFGSAGWLAFPSFSVGAAAPGSESWFDRLPCSIQSNENRFDDDPLTREIDLFSRVLIEKAPPHATIDDAIQNLAVVEAIRKSLVSRAFEEVAPLCAQRARESRVLGGRECAR
jgi:predicted dehydrogenase